MPRLTKRVVDVAEAGPSQAIIWDSEVKGFGLRIMPSGVKSYVLQYRVTGGRSRRYTIGKHGSPWTVEEARRKAAELLHEIGRGGDPLEAKAEARAALTVADLVELYLAEGPAAKPNKKPSSWETDASNLRRHVLPLLGKKPMKAVTSADVARLQADVAAGKTAADVKTGWRGRARVRGGKGIASRAVAALPARFPSILIGEGQVVREANTLTANHRRVYATLHVWAKAMPQARAIAGAITSAVEHQPLTLATGYRAISAVIASARFMRDEEEAHGVVTVDSLVEVTA